MNLINKKRSGSKTIVSFVKLLIQKKSEFIFFNSVNWRDCLGTLFKAKLDLKFVRLSITYKWKILEEKQHFISSHFKCFYLRWIRGRGFNQQLTNYAKFMHVIENSGKKYFSIIFSLHLFQKLFSWLFLLLLRLLI